MMMNSIMMNTMMMICQRCGWEWESRKVDPASCPRCKSYNWRLAPEKKSPTQEKPSPDERKIVPFEDA